MSDLFIPADELKQRFCCSGVFYRLQLASGREIRCRSVLNIMDRSLPMQAHLGCVDAMAVMMNPGSSRPLATDDGGPLVTAGDIQKLPSLVPVPARPDITQYQIMRLMLQAGWRRLRVVNLSDIREPKSPALFAMLRKLDREADGGIHSMFSHRRHAEWVHWAGLNTGPVVVGWGRAPDLEPLAGRCLSALEGRTQLGVMLPEHPLRTAHPSPQLKRLKVAWLAALVCQIQAAHPPVSG